MRVLFCSQAAHTGGGVEAWLETLSAELAACGWDVVTALAKGRFHDPARYAARHRVLNPIEIDGTRGLRELRILELLRAFERVRPDVIIPVNLADALDAAALWKSRGAKTRLAVCVHGQSADRIEQLARVAPFIDLAVSVSRRVTDQLFDLIGERERVRHIPMGVPPPLTPPLPRERIRNVAYIGRLDRGEKRVGDAVPMIRALAEHGIAFHFAGSGPDEEWLRREAPTAIFHGAVDRNELYATIYPSIDAIVIFSESETGPIVAWEAMAHGVIPVVSDYVGRAEENVIRDGETGIVFPVGDPIAGAQAIVRANVLSLHTSLPEAYTLASFGKQWCDALDLVTRLPARLGDHLPSMVSPGLLARLGLGLEATARVRRLLGRSFTHRDPGSEWPH